jgi:O-antigen ligase
MHWLLIGYMFLFIDRPFEVWPKLGELRLERIYMLGTLAVWLVYPGKRILANLQQLAYAGFAFCVAACWAISPWSEQGQPIVEDWFKILTFYVLLVTTVHEERTLKKVVVGFVIVMGLYLLHSFREYLGGRHTFRMGIARMIGVDSTLGDPNSFGASIVFVLPFIPAFWRSNIGGRFGKLLLTGLLGLCGLCILLTGSRSSLIGLGVWGLLFLIRTRRGWLGLLVVAAVSPIVFQALPPSLQLRFETIINPEAGPENARQSGDGRIEGFFTGLELWSANPLTGIGPGAWRPATKSKIESHNLYGQLTGELGTLGVFAFSFLLWCFWRNIRRIRRLVRVYEIPTTSFLVQLNSAIGMSVFLLLFMGNFGHNLFRFTWLWYGGFLIIANHCLTVQIRRMVATDHEDDEPIVLEAAAIRPETLTLLGQ